MTKALLHVGVALALGWFAPDLFDAAAAYGAAATLVAVFALLLPVLVYTFLASAWVLKIAHDAISHYRH